MANLSYKHFTLGAEEVSPSKTQCPRRETLLRKNLTRGEFIKRSATKEAFYK